MINLKPAQRCALAAAGEKVAWRQYKLKARKMHINCGESEPSAARCVRRHSRATYSFIPMDSIGVDTLESQGFIVRAMNQEGLSIPFNFDYPRF